MRPHHQALRQNRAGTDVDLTEDHRGLGDLGLGLVNEKVRGLCARRVGTGRLDARMARRTVRAREFQPRVTWRSDNTWAQSRLCMTGDRTNHVQTLCLRY